MSRTTKRLLLAVFLVLIVIPGLTLAFSSNARDEVASLRSCLTLARSGFRPIAEERQDRFLGKVQEFTARCRGGSRALAYRSTPWVDWSNYWATGGPSSRSGPGILGHLSRDGRGLDGALLDLEYQRIELLKFILFDNLTFPEYVQGRDGIPGRSLKVWAAMRLPPDDAAYEEVGGAGEQLCSGELIRYRTLNGICNDIRNPRMGSTGMVFGRNVQFEETFPLRNATQLVRNRHGDRLGLLRPDPAVISRELFTRRQEHPEQCLQGTASGPDAHCDYVKAPFFNVLAAFWIQFMTHDWFGHLDEGKNSTQLMSAGCREAQDDGVARPLTPDEVAALGCRPGDLFDRALMADTTPPPTFSADGQTRLARAPRTTRNLNTAWWDASQLYGYSDRSARRVKRDPSDRAKLLMVHEETRSGTGDAQGYLPVFQQGDPILPSWAGQESVAFPDNWSIGLSFYHNLFAREHNLFVDEFRRRAAADPDGDSGLRDPANPSQVIRYRDVTDENIFQAARLVVAAEIAKIHTIEWTPAMLPQQAANLALNANWYGLATYLFRSRKHRRARSTLNIRHPEAGGVVGNSLERHGSPYGLTEEFVEVYRLHPLLPEELVLRRLDTGEVTKRVPLAETRQAGSAKLTRAVAMDDLFYSFGNQHPGQLVLNNYPRFMQALSMPGNPVFDLGAVDILRARERGVPRYNEFRRQLGLNPVRCFEDLTRDPQRLAALREVYGDGPEALEDLDLLIGTLAEDPADPPVRPTGFAFGETLFQIFILNATRRLQADRFYTDCYDELTYTAEGLDWIDDADLKTVLLRHYPALARSGLANVRNAFEPWDTGERLEPARHPLRAWESDLQPDPWIGDAHRLPAAG